MDKLSIIVPVYNEIKTLPVVFKSLNRLKISCNFEVIIVDDSSIDGSAQWLESVKKKYSKQNRFKFLFHEQNLGKGGAIQTGLKVASGDYLLIQDADLEYSPNEIENLIVAQKKNQALAVFGSRNTKERPNRYLYPHYYIGSWFLSLLLQIFFGCRLTDPETCYKLVHTDLFRFLSVRENGFGIEMEIVAKILRLKIKIFEVPISYKPRSFEQGKKIRVKDGIYAVKLLFKLFFTDLQYGLVDRFLRWRREANATKHLHLGSDQTVVDAGCGKQAHLGWKLKSRIKNYIGIDHDLETLVVDNMHLYSVDMHNLNKINLNGKVDTLVGLAIIEHLENPEKFISQSLQLLKKNGKIILTTPHPLADKILKLLGELKMIDSDEIYDHKRYFTIDQLANLLTSIGFEIVVKKRFLWGLNSCVVARKAK